MNKNTEITSLRGEKLAFFKTNLNNGGIVLPKEDDNHASFSTKASLIDVEELGKSKEFQEILPYSNTNQDMQRKGINGTTK